MGNRNASFGGSIALIIIGAILAFAVRDSLSGVDLTMIGYIVGAAGLLWLILTLVTNSRSVRSETHRAVDPHTGDTVTRHESSL